MQTVEVKGVGLLDFPDSMSQDEIKAVLQQKYGNQQPANDTPQGIGAEYGVQPQGVMGLSEAEAEQVASNAVGGINALGQGATFGLLDEAQAGVLAFVGTNLPESMGGLPDGVSFLDAYRGIRDEIRGGNAEFAKENPKTSLALNLAGGVATGGLGVAKAVGAKALTTTGSKLLAGSAAGATEGGIAGAGYSEGKTTGEVFDDAKTGAQIGAAFGAVGGGIGAYIGSKAAKSEVLKAAIKNNPDSRVVQAATKGFAPANNTKILKAAQKQGFDDGALAVVLGSSREDKGLMRKMVNTFIKNKRNPKNALRNRPADVVGNSVAKRYKFVARKNRQAGADIDRIAETQLKGKPIGGLDMSSGARLERARQQGFDVDNVHYHGTNADFSAMQANKGLAGRGVYLGDKHTGNIYGGGSGGDISGGNVIATYIRGKKASQSDVAAARRAIGEGWDNDQINSYLAKKGFSYRDAKTPDIVVFDPKNIKSTHAAFDPAQVNSGKLVDDIAGQSLSDDFLNKLKAAGVELTEDGLDFNGSDFDPFPDSQSLIKKVFKQASTVRDAHDAHKLKRTIDKLVTYGKSNNKSADIDAERLVKGFRRQIDQALDGKFPDYDEANTIYAQTRGALDDVDSLIGKASNPDSANFDKTIGTLARRISSNAMSGGRVDDAFVQLDDVAKQLNGGFTDDFDSLVVFSNEFERMFKSQASTSLKGIGETVAEGATSPTRMFTTKAAELVDNALGVNEDNALIAIRRLLAE